ncbi:MAG: ATP-binding cassette domain-containing protein [Candidatus Pacebacteria bacterium]|nr:ATP-binding cassette domain-containing protein [Candidatus Paceibacterota bacterium]
MKLQIKDLKVKIIDSGKEIIENANLEISSGEAVAITGRNGSGKSSLLSAIFKHPNFEILEGQILLEKDEEKIDLTNLKTFEIARHGLYLSLQHVPEIEGVNLLQFLYRSYKNVFPESPLGVLDFNKEIIAFSQAQDIDESFLKRELNIGFSGGEKKQAEMLHLFALKPKMVFMDEIDSGVDKNAIEKVFKIINGFKKEGTAFCLVSHREKLEDLIELDKKYEMENNHLKLC